MNIKNHHYVFLAIILVAAFLVRYDLNRRVANLNTNAPVAIDSTAQSPIAREAAPMMAATPAPVPAVPTQDLEEAFRQKFFTEASDIIKLQGDADAVEKKLRTLAANMNQRDVQALYEVISDENQDGERRALAVELLSIKNDTASLTVLQNFVANKKTVNGTEWDPKKEIETILRAQAVESIAAYPQKDIALSTLSFLQRRVDEAFLNDRIGRASANLTGDPVFQLQPQTTRPQPVLDDSIRGLVQ